MHNLRDTSSQTAASGIASRAHPQHADALSPVVGYSSVDAYTSASDISDQIVGRMSKRLFDLAISFILLIVFLPLLVFVSLLIKMTSKGPIIFSQKRGGLHGKSFKIYKFRTMSVLEHGDDVIQVRRNDPRITKLGAFLRKTSLDELPQLINVLVGNMSLVGPRPHAIHHDRMFGRQIVNYNDRFAGRPGITGLAQIKGYRGEVSSHKDLANRVGSDIEYLNNWSFFGDVAILFKTVYLVFRDKNAF